MVLTQLETPLPVLEELLRIASQARVPVMLDPAPAAPLSPEILRQLSWFTPNETEAGFYADSKEGENATETNARAEEARALCLRFQQLGPRNILLKLGEHGAAVLSEHGDWHMVPAPRVEVVDTTGAGDTLNAAFAAALLRGEALEQALRFAVAAASISITRAGAMRAAPDHAEVERFLTEQH